MRVVKTHDERKNELLDTAQTLFYQNGYENTSITNVIEAVDIAKGTFYHYFKSKTDLLDQIVDRIAKNIDAIIDRILDEPEENAIDELNNIFREIGQYKAREKEVLLMMTRALYSDNNIVLKTKMLQRRIDTVAPRLAQVIARGVSEGLFTTADPAFTAELILHMAAPLGEKFAAFVLQDNLNETTKKMYINMCETYDRAVEKVLGAETGTLDLFDREIVEAFFEA